MTDTRTSLHTNIISEILNDLATEIENLGVALCQDSTVAEKYSCELQAIDLIAQKQRSLASLLMSGLTKSAIEKVGIDMLRERLTSSLPASLR